RCQTRAKVASRKLRLEGGRHELEASRAQRAPEAAGNLDEAARLAPIGRGRHAHPAMEERAEAPEARRAHLEADARHAVAAREQLLRALHAGADPALVRGLSEQAGELANEHARG